MFPRYMELDHLPFGMIFKKICKHCFWETSKMTSELNSEVYLATHGLVNGLFVFYCSMLNEHAKYVEFFFLINKSIEFNFFRVCCG